MSPRRLRSVLLHGPTVQRRAKVVSLDVEAPLSDLTVEDAYDEVALILRVDGLVVGSIILPAAPMLSAARLWEAIVEHSGERIWRQRLRSALRDARRDLEALTAPSPAVSVVVCTRDRPVELRACLESLGRLRTAPLEVIVVDNASATDATAVVCAEFDVRYVREPIPVVSRARNRGIVESRGEVVAFTDDDCVVDPAWLDGLGAAFADPLVMAVGGYIGPIELEHTSQCIFESRGGFPHLPAPEVMSLDTTSPLKGAAMAAGANLLFRREVFERVGLFAEDLGPGTPARAADDTYALYRLLAAGYRSAYDPARIVWHKHRRDWPGLRHQVSGYSISSFAYLTRCLLRHRDLEALWMLRWWLGYFGSEAKGALRRRDTVALALTTSELAGALRGPWCLARSVWSRRGVAPVVLAQRGVGGGVRAPRVEVVGEAVSLSVAVASRDRCGLLRGVLEGLAAQEFAGERFEVVLVLDGCGDDSAVMARSLALPYRLRVVEQPNRGLAASRNRGAAEAQHPIVVFLDDDIVPVAGFLAEHARAHRDSRDDHVALGYCAPVIAGDGLWALTLRALREDHFRRKLHPHHQWSFVDVSDGNMSLPKALLTAVGGYDETAFREGRRQDWELGIRLLEHGTRLAYHPAAKGWHHLDCRFSTALSIARQDGRADVALVAKHPTAAPSLPLAALAGATHRSRATTAALAHAPRLAPLTPIALGILNTLEAAHLRWRWRQLTHNLLATNYTAGVLDRTRSRAQTLRLLQSTPAPDHPNVPLWHRDGQFDWDAAVEQAVIRICDPTRLAAALAAASRLHGAPDARSGSAEAA